MEKNSTYFFEGLGLTNKLLIAEWMVSESKLMGRSLHEYVNGTETLKHFGVRKKNAIERLKPMVRNWHIHYNENADPTTEMQDFEQFYTKVLYFQACYFLEKNAKGRQKKQRSWNCWPIAIPPKD